MGDLAPALAILSAMITPAVLILATGSLILTTSQRLGRSVERARKISDAIESLARDTSNDLILEEKKIMLFFQLKKVAGRSMLLQRGMTLLYSALAVFVATSVVIGLFEVIHIQFQWLPIVLGIVGACLLFYASLVLISESRLALTAVNNEMRYILLVGNKLMPEEKKQKRKKKRKPGSS